MARMAESKPTTIALKDRHQNIASNLTCPFVQFHFTTTNRTHVACPITEDILNQAAFLICVEFPLDGDLIKFSDGLFHLSDSIRMDENCHLKEGPILFITERKCEFRQDRVETHALFFTKQHYCSRPKTGIMLHEVDIDSFDCLITERFLQCAQKLPIQILVDHEPLLTDLSNKAQREMLQQKQKWLKTVEKETVNLFNST